MVSSTSTDLEAHRREVIDAINRFCFYPNVMEYSGARSDADVIDTSLGMVRDSIAYLCVIGHKYGQTPVDGVRNPNALSITELEFNEARRLGRPILLFLMGDKHPVTPVNVEFDAKKRKKVEAFRKQAKRIDPGAAAERVYETFASKDEFAKKAAIAVSQLAVQFADRSDLPDRAIRDAVARFIDVKPEAEQAELTDAIERFETDYRALEQQLAAIPVSDNRVTSLKADAEAALAQGDLDQARAAYRAAAEAALDKAAEPVRTAAELKAAEAGAHLLALDWEAANTAWTEAAAMLAPFDQEESDRLSEHAASRLRLHGELYASAGASGTSIDRLRGLVEAAKRRSDDPEAARLLTGLGSALRTLEQRTGATAGLRLLDEAIAVCREALTVRTRADMPAQWATTQNNLGVALRTWSERTGGSERLRLLDEAVGAFREALTIRTRNERAAQWAMTQNNLANALATQGRQTDDIEGLRLLDDAVTAYREALTVRTRADVPAKWAMTQSNLGSALWCLGERTKGAEGLRLLDQAVAAFYEVLTVFTRADMPARWATTHENLGLAFESMAAADPDRALAHLVNSEAAFVAALSVYTPEHMAFYHDKATRSLARVRAKLAARES